MINRIRNSGEFPTRGIGWHLAKARLSLLWENTWPALVPSVLVLAVFAAAVLFDIFILFPGWLHIVLLVVLLLMNATAIYIRHRLGRKPGQ